MTRTSRGGGSASTSLTSYPHPSEAWSDPARPDSEALPGVHPRGEGGFVVGPGRWIAFFHGEAALSPPQARAPTGPPPLGSRCETPKSPRSAKRTRAPSQRRRTRPAGIRAAAFARRVDRAREQRRPRRVVDDRDEHGFFAAQRRVCFGIQAGHRRPVGERRDLPGAGWRRSQSFFRRASAVARTCKLRVVQQSLLRETAVNAARCRTGSTLAEPTNRPRGRRGLPDARHPASGQGPASEGDRA